MARLARFSVIGYPHQVTQRGNYEQPVFEEEADFRRYLGWLRSYADRYKIEVWAYCLMPNHVHYVCIPKAEDALSRGFNALHMKYAQYFHGKKRVTGHLWKGRFLSCMLDVQSVFEEVRFIENDPVRAGLVAMAEEYPWSSARAHVHMSAALFSRGARSNQQYETGHLISAKKTRRRMSRNSPDMRIRDAPWEATTLLAGWNGNSAVPCPPRKGAEKNRK